MANLLGLSMTLPHDIFFFETLVSLSLYGEFELVLPHSVCLPCLRTCELIRVKFDNESARRLFQNCPALEILSIDSCHMGGAIKVLDISAPALKKLLICDYQHKGYQIALNVPNLLSFNYLGHVANEFSGLKSLKSLVHAWIHYILSSDSRGNVVVDLVCSICHVQHLQLYGEVEACFYQALNSGHPLPIFKNLTHLSLSLDSFSCLSDLLDKSPQLESISFDQGSCYDSGVDETISFLTEHVPACVSLHLKEVSLSFTGSVSQHKVIKYFLKFTQNLKKMKIQTQLSWNEQLEISSAACEIVLV